jgi:glycosyltransferase involved in cell wall biosynthesis
MIIPTLLSLECESRMRIVYVLTTLAVGGTERQVLAIAKRMAARGHVVVVMTLKPGEPDDCATELDVVHLDMHKGIASLIVGVRRGTDFLRTFHPDVVHSHNFHGNLLARMMRLFYRTPRLISTIHNIYEGGWLRMLAYRTTDWLVDRTTAVSGAVAERFASMKAVGKDECLVLLNGIEVSEFVPDPNRRAAMRAQMGVGNGFVWLTVGRVTAAKDLQNLLQAFGNVCLSDEHAYLWIAGERPPRERQRYEHFVAAMPGATKEKVRRLGLRRDIPALLDAADGFVLASAWEGMPLALGEAMAMEKPVVATDVGGVRELVGDAGVLVPAKDAAALGGAMLVVMRKSQEERAEMGRAARLRILEDFSMDAKAKEWEALYCSVLAHRAPPATVVP